MILQPGQRYMLAAVVEYVGPHPNDPDVVCVRILDTDRGYMAVVLPASLTDVHPAPR